MSFFGAPDPIQRYRASFPQRWGDLTPASEVRFVVLDTETTGLNPTRDLIVSIGAVAVQGGEIMLPDQFEVLLKIAYNSSSVLLHGVTREASQKGLEEAEALRMFLEYLQDSVIVGHHIGFDIEILKHRCQRRFDIDLCNQSVDTGWLAHRLDKLNALPAAEAESVTPDFSLDTLCHRLGISPHDRHTAAGDAFISAQLFIKLMRFAANTGLRTLGDLVSQGSPDDLIPDF